MSQCNIIAGDNPASQYDNGEDGDSFPNNSTDREGSGKGSGEATVTNIDDTVTDGNTVTNSNTVTYTDRKSVV